MRIIAVLLNVVLLGLVLWLFIYEYTRPDLRSSLFLGLLFATGTVNLIVLFSGARFKKSWSRLYLQRDKARTEALKAEKQ